MKLCHVWFFLSVEFDCVQAYLKWVSGGKRADIHSKMPPHCPYLRGNYLVRKVNTKSDHGDVVTRAFLQNVEPLSQPGPTMDWNSKYNTAICRLDYIKISSGLTLIPRDLKYCPGILWGIHVDLHLERRKLFRLAINSITVWRFWFVFNQNWTKLIRNVS